MNPDLHVHPALPHRVRARLAIVRRIDHTGGRLVDHGYYRVAEWMWRACRLW